MAKSEKKPKTGGWTDKLDPAKVAEAMEEATVDAYGDYENHTGLMTLIEDQLEFPFQVEALGEKVTVVGMEWPENDEFGLDLLVERDGKRHQIEARSVNLLRPFPKGHLFLAAYLDWKSRM